jgi:hypothetical protein
MRRTGAIYTCARLTNSPHPVFSDVICYHAYENNKLLLQNLKCFVFTTSISKCIFFQTTQHENTYCLNNWKRSLVIAESFIL